MFCVPRPSAPASFSGPEVPGDRASSWVKLRDESGSSFIALPSTTRPSAADSVCSSGVEAETSILSVTPAGFNTRFTAIRSVTPRMALAALVENPASDASMRYSPGARNGNEYWPEAEETACRFSFVLVLMAVI